MILPGRKVMSKRLIPGKTHYVVIGIICVVALVAEILLVRKRRKQ